MANSYLGLDRIDDALTAANEAFRTKPDYMTSVTCLPPPTHLILLNPISVVN
jgi:hypothetical protein